MTFETDRLLLIPLNSQQLHDWALDLKKLENELNVTYEAEPMEGIFLQIVKGQYEIINKNEENFMWHSFWLIVNKKDRIVIGSADFKDAPNQKGQVEIGYGLGDNFTGNGYMTEAILKMIDWAFSNKEVSEIIAETENDNIKSKSVLTRCGFKEASKGDTTWFGLKSKE